MLDSHAHNPHSTVTKVTSGGIPALGYFCHLYKLGS
jgi:hypothetical protein